MHREEISHELATIIDGLLKARGLELVDLIYRFEGGNLVLRVLTDRPEGGINIDECALLNKEISALLDEKDIIRERYFLEVSSPGLDRPLETRSDFMRNINRSVRFFLNEPIEGKLEHVGIILSLTGDDLNVEAGGKTLAIPLTKINKAKKEI